jgi:nucleoside recognition membrane protein YjiH
LAAAVLTYLCLEKIWLALLDLVCICGFVVTAVMIRGITAEYSCNEWLSRNEGKNDDGMNMLRARDGHERGECLGLRGVFGIAIVQW